MKSMLRVFSAMVCLAYFLFFFQSSSAYAVKTHNNDVFFHPTGGIDYVTFDQTNFDISSGQPYKGTLPSWDGQDLRITIIAGRHGTDDVADSFRYAAGGGETIACDSTGNWPDELNFWSQGDFEIVKDGTTYICSDIIIAQGHFTTTNNWWVSGYDTTNVTGLSAVGPLTKQCENQDGGFPGILELSPPQPCVNHFNLKLVF